MVHNLVNIYTKL